MRKFLAGIIWACLHAAAPVYAQATAVPAVAPVYGLLSLVGDQLGIVVAQPQTDARLAPYKREAILIDEPVFDDAAINAASEAIRKVVPQADLSALQTRSPVLFDRQRVLFEEKGSAIAVPEAIKAALAQQKATYLVLITKHRDEINLQFGHDRNISGKLEGIGFYVDDTLTASRGTGTGSGGFIAPFAYLRVALIDTRNWQVIAKQTITASTTIASAQTLEASSPWNAMTSAEKIRAMDRLLRRELGRVIPILLKTG
jgi:hypothetical protein